MFTLKTQFQKSVEIIGGGNHFDIGIRLQSPTEHPAPAMHWCPGWYLRWYQRKLYLWHDTGAQSSEQAAHYERSTILSIDHFQRLSRCPTEPCVPLLLIVGIAAFIGYHWPSGEDAKDVFVGRRQSPLRPDVSASLQERHWEQPEVAEVSNERERKENSTDANCHGDRKAPALEVMALERGESVAKQQEEGSDAPAWFLLISLVLLTP